MKKIEHAPQWADEHIHSEVYKLILNGEFQQLLNEINERYLYWDKVKYQKSDLVSNPQALLSALKLGRSLNAKSIQFVDYKFTYNLTDFVQKGLHEFDLHIGGHLGSKNLIPEDDKKCIQPSPNLLTAK